MAGRVPMGATLLALEVGGLAFRGGEPPGDEVEVREDCCC